MGQAIHRCILNGIDRLAAANNNNNNNNNGVSSAENGHKKRLIIRQEAHDTRQIQRRSVQYLVDFLQTTYYSYHHRHHPTIVKELTLTRVSFSTTTNDGGLDILTDFIENDTTLTRVELSWCSFHGGAGQAQDGGGGDSSSTVARLLTAFQRNTTIQDLTLGGFYDLSTDAAPALGQFLVELLCNNTTQLQRLDCSHSALQFDGRGPAQQFQPTLQAEQHPHCLKELCLSYCWITDDGLGCIAHALVGNTSLQVLDINPIAMTASGGLDHVTKLLESTRLQEIRFGQNSMLLDNQENRAQRFACALSRNKFLQTLIMSRVQVTGEVAVMMFQALESNTTLQNWSFCRIHHHHHHHHHQVVVDPQQQLLTSLAGIKGLKRLHMVLWNFLLRHQPLLALVPALHKNTSLEELPGLDLEDFPQHGHVITAIKNVLERNRSLKRAASLLVQQPLLSKPPAGTEKSVIDASSGIWHKSIVKLARKGSGASAIFQILQTRPIIVIQ